MENIKIISKWGKVKGMLTPGGRYIPAEQPKKGYWRYEVIKDGRTQHIDLPENN